MSQLSNVVGVVAELFRGAGGLQANLDAVAAAEGFPRLMVTDHQVITLNVPADIAERSTAVKYPCIHVYCEKAANLLREKARTFSGEITIAVEVRVSADRVEDLDAQMNLMVDAVTTTLEQNRGDWGAGIFFGGGYEIGYGGIKHGGKNFTQTAKVTLGMEVSRN